jgi:chromosome partitioning protein
MQLPEITKDVGQRVATIDLDSRPRSLTRYMENRRAWASHARIDLKVPMHFCVAMISHQ